MAITVRNISVSAITVFNVKWFDKLPFSLKTSRIYNVFKVHPASLSWDFISFLYNCTFYYYSGIARIKRTFHNDPRQNLVMMLITIWFYFLLKYCCQFYMSFLNDNSTKLSVFTPFKARYTSIMIVVVA